MKVLYDHQIFEMQKVGGISRGFAQILARFPEEIKYEIALKESDNIYLDSYSLKNESTKILSKKREDFLKGLEFKGKNRLYDLLCKYNMISSVESRNLHNSELLLKKQDFDVFHPTYFSDYFLPFLRNKPFVLTVHDLTPENYPQFFNRNDFQTKMRKVLVPKASHIIVPSLCTKNDVINRWSIPEDNITVIHWGADCNSEMKYDMQSLFDFRYILFVGLRDGYKNFNFFISEAASFLHKYTDIKVVCTGRDLSLTEQLLIKSLDLEGRVKTIFASDEEMISLYSNALCFVFPSLSEGFGLPTIEAFQYGCPVLLYNGTCHPEIGGKAAFYFNSDNKTSDIANELEMIEGLSLKERSSVIQQGYEQLKLFSWDRTSQQYIDVYKRVI